MKITDPDVIKNSEKDLIKAVRNDLDLEVVKEILKKRMAAAALSSKGGEIVVHQNEIAFRLDFDIQLSGSLMFDRQGNYIPESNETRDPETRISENLDLVDIPDNTPPEEDLDKDLLDYALDDTVDGPSIKIEQKETSQTGPEEIEAIEIDMLDQPADASELDPETGTDDFIPDDLVDDDINDILKESREFWEFKKDE
ncbi:hypothetical protein [Desulfobacula sp.]|uniref:hypothetical protein n=1 Tax=Desulfobacula sp. TaxID=2593537 RepID=UPI00261BD685|nr:hypothetical protein [Desulfobacula sp.]